MSDSLAPSPRIFVGPTTRFLRYFCPLGLIGCVVFAVFADAPHVLLAIAIALFLIFGTFCSWRAKVEVYPDRIRIVYPFEELTISRADIVSIDANIGIRSTSHNRPFLLLRDGQQIRLAPFEPFRGGFGTHSRVAAALAEELGVPETPPVPLRRSVIVLLFAIPIVIVLVVLIQSL